jgi:hypothetical protein
MDTKATSVFGIFQDVSSLRRAAMALRDAEYRNSAVSVLFPDKQGAMDFAQEEKKTSAPQGFTFGSRIGGVIGGAFGWLTGSGALTIPGLDSFIASGPIVATLAGVGVGGVVGGILGALVHLGIRARRYEDHRKSGGFLISVHCDDTDSARGAETILKNTGADAVSFCGSAAA